MLLRPMGVISDALPPPEYDPRDAFAADAVLECAEQRCLLVHCGILWITNFISCVSRETAFS